VAELTSDSDAVSPVLSFTARSTTHGRARRVRWTVDGRDTSIGYANGVATPEGGTHINGFRNAITEAVQRYITDRGLLKDKEQVPTTRDIFGAAMTVVSIMIPGPQFAGNSKSKLMNTEASARTRAIVLPIMTRWLEENPADAKRSPTCRVGDAVAHEVQRRAAGRAGAAVEGLEVAQRAAAQAARLHRQDRPAEGAAHRRGRLRGRHRARRPRPVVPGDPAAARQAAQHVQGSRSTAW
jgi:DNA gyrase/topoisomerase IV subunit B